MVRKLCLCCLAKLIQTRCCLPFTPRARLALPSFARYLHALACENIRSLPASIIPSEFLGCRRRLLWAQRSEKAVRLHRRGANVGPVNFHKKQCPTRSYLQNALWSEWHWAYWDIRRLRLGSARPAGIENPTDALVHRRWATTLTPCCQKNKRLQTEYP